MDAKMQKHQVTVTYGFDAEDDDQARRIAKIILGTFSLRSLWVDESERLLIPDSRLHRIHDDKQPEVMEL